MITAVDTNVLLNVLIPRSAEGDASQALLDNAAAHGKLVIADVVVAELSAHFPSREKLEEFTGRTGLIQNT
ncbi:MAG: hypothetical protein ACYDAG_08080 [Chloroflexota bacterium]